MGTPINVAVIVGSLRKESFNRKLANVLVKQAPPELQLSIVEIGELPLFNQDDEASPTAAVTAFKEKIKAAGALLFVTPEYNRSVPGVLKNALDVGSRPYGQSAWGGKPGAVISVSPGAIGGFGANHHLRQTLSYLDIAVLNQPETYLGNAGKLFDDTGALASEDTKKFLDGFLQAFAKLVARHSAP